MIKTVIFDIGNVLAKFAWYEHHAALGYDDETIDKIGKATLFTPAWGEYDLGNLTDDEIVELFVKNDPSIEKELRESHVDFTDLVTRYDYAIPWICELKEKGYQVLYLSNFSEKALKECSPALDFLPHMDGGVFSCKVHFIKPDARIYEAILTKYNLNASECVFIDDMDVNIEGAKNAGMHGIVFSSYEQAREDLATLGVK